MDTKRFFLYAIVIVALTLAGCGGGGGGTQTAMPDPTPPDPMVTCPDGSTAPTMDDCPPAGPTPEEMALSDAQDAASAAYMAAMAAVGGAKDYVAMQNAQKYADMAKEANDAAQAATTSAMAEEYQMAAETARDQAQEAAMMRGLGITTLANKIVNEQQIENAELEGRPAVKPRNNAERVGPALKGSAGIVPVVTDITSDVAAAAVTATAGGGSVSQGSSNPAGTSPPGTGDPANVAASATVTLDDVDSPGLTITVTRGGDPINTAADRLLAGEEPTKLKARGGWSGREFVRTEAAVTGSEPGMTYANVYTDIQPPTQAYEITATDLNSVPGLTSGVTATTPTTSVIVAGEVAEDGSSFAATVNLNPRDNQPPVMGQFRCAAGTSCSISVDASGKIVGGTGYTFHESSGVTTQDSDYLAWGVWLTVPGAVTTTGAFPAGTTTTGVFASGRDVFSVNAALKGKATYNGVANGLYSAGGMVETFDADVMLEANFGGSTEADSTPATTANDRLLMGAVTGTVSNINAGGMAVDGSLMLLRAPVLSGSAATAGTTPADLATASTPSTSGFQGNTDGILGGVTYRGEWGGQFYGPNKATTDMARETEFPTTAAGTFGAAAENGASILGSFGSWKAE